MHVHILLKVSFYSVTLLPDYFVLGQAAPDTFSLYFSKSPNSKRNFSMPKQNPRNYTYRGTFLLCLYIYISEVVNWWLTGCTQPPAHACCFAHRMLVQILNLLPMSTLRGSA